MTSLTSTARIRIYDPVAREYRTAEVPAEAPPKPHDRRRTRSHGAPRVLNTAGNVAPLPEWWRDTAYAPSYGWADMRTMRREDPTIRPAHRPAQIYPAPK